MKDDGNDACRAGSACGGADLRETLDRFDSLQGEVFALQYAQQVMNFDAETVGPVKGARARCEAIANLSRLEFEAAYGDRAKAIVEGLAPFADELDELHADEYRVFSRSYRKMGAVPVDVRSDFARLKSAAVGVWKRAKATNDFSLFEPYLSDILASMKRQAGYLDPDRDPYEVWLDWFERGLTRRTVEDFFELVQAEVVPLVREIGELGREEPEFLHAVVPYETQREICRRAVEFIGVDMDALYIGDTEHPFTDGFAHDDVRIANHIFEDSFASALFSAVHEGGHTLYEQGIDERYDFTCLRGGTSMGVHESQSRFMENVIARSEEFCEFLLPLIQEAAPGAFDGLTPRELYFGISQCKPGLIRTEADELTYPLHILVRYKIESALFAGELSVHDAPDCWNQLMRRYLGVEVPDDSRGILQDTHWASGYVGYFPSYAIGSAYAAQFMHAMGREFDVLGCVGRGDLVPVRTWLRDRIWKYGSSKDPDWIISNACGEKFDPRYYTAYLSKKYRSLYSL